MGNGSKGEDAQLEPSIGEQHIFAASANGVLLAIDRESGKVLWKNATKLSLTAGPAAGYGSVVVATDKGELQAYAEDDGHLLWQVTLGAVSYTKPAVASDTIIVLTGDGVIHALDRTNGHVRWTYNTSVPPLSLRGNAAPLLDDGRVYVATSGGKLVGLDVATGVAGWDVRVAINTGRSELERMSDVVGDLLQADNGIIYSIGYQSQLTATMPDNGRRRWQLDASSVNHLAAGLGNVYFTDTSGYVFSVDESSGKVGWKQPAYAWRTLTGPTIVGGLLAVGDNKGAVHLLAQSDGEVRGRVRVGVSPLVTIVGREDMLYSWDRTGYLSAWQLRR